MGPRQVWGKIDAALFDSVQLQQPVELGAAASSPRRFTPRCCWLAELAAGSVFGNFLADEHTHIHVHA